MVLVVGALASSQSAIQYEPRGSDDTDQRDSSAQAPHEARCFEPDRWPSPVKHAVREDGEGSSCSDEEYCHGRRRRAMDLHA